MVGWLGRKTVDGAMRRQQLLFGAVGLLLGGAGMWLSMDSKIQGWAKDYCALAQESRAAVRRMADRALEGSGILVRVECPGDRS